MRLSQTPPSLLSLLLVALSNLEQIRAFPLGEFDFGALLLGRTTCVSYCGADNQFCCTQGQACTTLSGNVATCMAAAGVAATGQGGYAVYTTTYTETDLVLRTSTYTSNWVAAPSVQPLATTALICTTSLGESSCGSICCAADQGCLKPGNSCTARATSWVYVPTASAPVASVPTSGTYSAPLRPTSGGVSTATATISPTTTQPFIPPATASGSSLPIVAHSSNNGLSGGAIAGIVIGVIAGIILLLLLCFCCIVKAGFDGILGIFGLGKNRKRRDERVVITEEERYSRHSAGGGSRPVHSGWFGGAGRPARVTEERKKKSSGFGGLGGVGAGLLGLAVVLGLKRNHDKKEKAAASHAGRSDLSSSYYSYEDSYTGSSPTQVQMTEEVEAREIPVVRVARIEKI
ncbi:hypothetical protein GLAREA_07683 [Glarea lozoyensis ATCC 20868]|uniref:Uncharacterized protein n=1 Tax=Glarea lozoyensis (strain ATCC 20868 / MF5171) TaxID=1116229 RepID=S3D5Z0_GLAL2|nr:uncharacterized protein GLAREA_07683 [Glarea lozoyensis ATCC 20868]EPE32549.1 hypothetical protein GLAREA_07683 [Glarea lozoyensis ATCC 20868]